MRTIRSVLHAQLPRYCAHPRPWRIPYVADVPRNAIPDGPRHSSRFPAIRTYLRSRIHDNATTANSLIRVQQKTVANALSHEGISNRNTIFSEHRISLLPKSEILYASVSSSNVASGFRSGAMTVPVKSTMCALPSSSYSRAAVFGGISVRTANSINGSPGLL